MSSSKNPTQGTRRKGPETLLALRDTLINDLRTHHGADQASESSGGPDEIPEEFHDSPGITAAELPNDLAPRQGNLPSNELTSDSSGVTPVEPPIGVARWPANLSSNPVTSDNTGLTPAETASDLHAERLRVPTGEDSHGAPSFVAEESSRDKPSFAKQVLRTIAGGLFIIAIIGTALTLLSFRQDRPWDRALSWLSSVFPVATGSFTAPHNQPVTVVSDFAVMQRQIDALADRQDRMVRDIATRQDQLDKTVNDFTVVGRQVNELAGRQDQITRDIATRQDQLMVSDIAVVRRQVEELAAKQDQMAASTATRQDQLRTMVSDVTGVRRQEEQLAVKQDQLAGSIAARQDQLKTMASDFAAVRRQIEELAAKQGQMAGTIATPQDQLKTMLSDIAVVRRQAEELAAKQDQMAQEIANLQTTERSLSQKIASPPQYRTVRNRSHRKAR